nr:ribonuclease H-like domain-containing protein [Tanacetum cinerariifolium]
MPHMTYNIPVCPGAPQSSRYHGIHVLSHRPESGPCGLYCHSTLSPTDFTASPLCPTSPPFVQHGPQEGSSYVSGNYMYMSNAFQSHATMLSQSFSTMTLQLSSWNMDTGASSHLADNTGILTSFSNSSIYPCVLVGNGNSIPVTHTERSFLHTSHKLLHLNHILVTPRIIKDLICVRKFTRDNDVSVEFDAYGFSVKDYQTQKLLLRCNSTGDLYPVTQQASFQTLVALLSFSSTTWHRRLGHLEEDVLRRLQPSN